MIVVDKVTKAPSTKAPSRYVQRHQKDTRFRNLLCTPTPKRPAGHLCQRTACARTTPVDGPSPALSSRAAVTAGGVVPSWACRHDTTRSARPDSSRGKGHAPQRCVFPPAAHCFPLPLPHWVTARACYWAVVHSGELAATTRGDPMHEEWSELGGAGGGGAPARRCMRRGPPPPARRRTLSGCWCCRWCGGAPPLCLSGSSTPAHTDPRGSRLLLYTYAAWKHGHPPFRR
jgi:hypothetical protein